MNTYAEKELTQEEKWALSDKDLLARLALLLKSEYSLG